MTTFTSVLLAALVSIPHFPFAQQAPPAAPAAAPAPSASSEQPVSSSPSPSSKSKNKQIPSFLILGTVFNEKSLSFPDVQVRIRRTGEKRFRWETYTNSRGEFAVRVPPGYNYEVIAHMKNYQDQIQSVDSKIDVQQRLSIKLELLGQAKTGAKP
jgi:hypothetical protein